MKLAILGTDPDIIALVEAALAAGHAVAWLGDVRRDDAPALERLLPGLRESADWESLLDHALVDAVLVGRGQTDETLRAEQLKRLVADVMPVLAVQPISTSVLTYFELDMARHEVHGVLRHYSPWAVSPAVAELGEWVQSASGEIGIVHQIVCQRQLPDCARESVVRHLARDVEVLRAIAGGVRTVSAVGPKLADASYASLQVQMTGPGAATLRWTVAPASGSENQATFTLIGERGTATLELPADHPQIAIIVGGRTEKFSTPPFDAPRAAIDVLNDSIAASGTAASERFSTWPTATAAMEIVDTIELSLQKGRTIEVHQQRLTEQLAFRGTMAAFGCGLLLVMFFGLVAAGLMGDVLGVPLKQYWPIALLVVLALFLAMQALPWLVKRKRPEASSSDSVKHDDSLQ
jgi:predicted dehydrogenase